MTPLIPSGRHWITTEYNNQDDVANFWTLAEAEGSTVKNPLFSFGGM